MNNLILLPLLLGSGGGIPNDAFVVTATLAAETLEVGNEYAVEIEVKLKDGWSASDSGIPKPMLQIDAPKCIKLSGKVLKDFRELSRNEFLQEPYERLIKVGKSTVKFKLTRKPRANERIAMNVLAYLSDDTNGNAHYVRRRLLLPIEPNAVSEAGDATESTWGVVKTLQIGDKAKLFSLPQADGKRIKLRDYLGKKNILVTTYRAYW
ncbi:MAG: hypothetical protein IID33_03300 [Planctomycetes bacterium]|nr:hypothetical protein [Planctomycetota bacterium]